MMDDLDSIGTVISGAVLAGTIEAERAPGRDGHTHEYGCLNCATPLTGPFCNACGQHAHVHRTLGAFFHDLAHGVFHVEGRTWRTLPLLAWRPGELTRRYIEGERVKFVSPMALFLFSVFLMFAVVSKMVPVTVMADPKAQDAMRSKADGSAANLARLKQQRAVMGTRHQPTTAIDAQIVEATQQTTFMQSMAKDGVLKGGAVTVSDDVPAWLREPIRHASANPDLLLYKLKSGAYKWSWALIPLSVPFLWLLFPFSRRFRLYDHTVFVTYSLSFMTLLVVAVAFVSTAALAAAPIALFLIPPVHMYRQLKGAYSLSTAGAVVRTLALLFAAVLALTLFAMAMVAVGVLD
jgi:hypothetical protein